MTDLQQWAMDRVAELSKEIERHCFDGLMGDEARDIIARALADAAKPKWSTDIENAPKEAHVWAWGNNFHWRNGGVAYVHDSYNGHKGIVTKNGCAGQPFCLSDDDAPTHFMEIALPAAPEVG